MGPHVRLLASLPLASLAIFLSAELRGISLATSERLSIGNIGDPAAGTEFGRSAAEYLQNPGFESGSLSPWFTDVVDGWTVVTTTPHSGTYSAYADGNKFIRQNFPPIDTSRITLLTFWAKQPGPNLQIQVYDFFYSDDTFDFFTWAPGDDWTQVDATAQLRPNATLVAIRIFGAENPDPDPDETWIDDVSLQVAPASVEPTTWGGIKSAYRTDAHIHRTGDRP